MNKQTLVEIKNRININKHDVLTGIILGLHGCGSMNMGVEIGRGCNNGSVLSMLRAYMRGVLFGVSSPFQLLRNLFGRRKLENSVSPN
jgi:hypothetical protein